MSDMSSSNSDWLVVEEVEKMAMTMAEMDISEGATRVVFQTAMRETQAVEDLLTAQRDKFFGPRKTCAPGPLIFFHGTSWENAESIQQDGFIPSEAGCLGPGIYVGRFDKALRFARDAERHGSDVGGKAREFKPPCCSTSI